MPDITVGMNKTGCCVTDEAESKRGELTLKLTLSTNGVALVGEMWQRLVDKFWGLVRKIGPRGGWVAHDGSNCTMEC